MNRLPPCNPYILSMTDAAPPPPPERVPWFDQWRQFLVTLADGAKFPPHLRVRVPDLVFFTEHNYPSVWFTSDPATWRLQRKTAMHLTLDRVVETFLLKLRQSENKRAEHVKARAKRSARSNRTSPVGTPPLLMVSLVGSHVGGGAAAAAATSQNSSTMLLNADGFEEVARRWIGSELEQRKSLPRALQLVEVPFLPPASASSSLSSSSSSSSSPTTFLTSSNPDHEEQEEGTAAAGSVSFLTCLMQPGFAPFSVTCHTYAVPLDQRLGLTLPWAPRRLVNDESACRKLSEADPVAVRLKRSLVGMAQLLSQSAATDAIAATRKHAARESRKQRKAERAAAMKGAQGRRSPRGTAGARAAAAVAESPRASASTATTITRRLHGCVVEFSVSRDSHVDLVKVLGTHFRGETPSWSRTGADVGGSGGNRCGGRRARSPAEPPTADDLLAAALMKRLYATSPVGHSARLDDGGQTKTRTKRPKKKKAKRAQAKTVAAYTPTAAARNSSHPQAVAKANTPRGGGGGGAGTRRRRPQKPTGQRRSHAGASNSAPAGPRAASRQVSVLAARPGGVDELGGGPAEAKGGGAKGAPFLRKSAPPPPPPESVMTAAAVRRRAKVEMRMAAEEKATRMAQAQVADERKAMFRALAEAQAARDASEAALQASQKLVQELSSRLTASEQQAEDLGTRLATITHESEQQQVELLRCRQQAKEHTTLLERMGRRLEVFWEAAQSITRTSGMDLLVTRDTLEVTAGSAVNDDSGNRSAGTVKEHEEEDADVNAEAVDDMSDVILATMQLKCAEHFDVVRRAFVAYAQQSTGTKADGRDESSPAAVAASPAAAAGLIDLGALRTLRIKSRQVLRMLKDGDLISRSFTADVATHMFSSALVLSKDVTSPSSPGSGSRRSKLSSSSASLFPLSSGAQFPVFLHWLIWVSQVRFRSFFGTRPAEKFEMLIKSLRGNLALLQDGGEE